MGSFLIEVGRVLFHHLDTLLFIEEEERVEAFATDGANEPFASRIRFGRANRGAAESIRDLDEIARPDGLGMVTQKGTPRLRRLWGAIFRQVLLNRLFAHAQTEFEEFAPDPFSSPHGVFVRHLLDQRHHAPFEQGLASRLLRLGTPETLEQVMMPAQQCLWLNEQGGFFPSAQQTGDPYHRQSIQSHKLGTFDLPVVVSANPSRLSECTLPLDKHLR